MRGDCAVRYVYVMVVVFCFFVGLMQPRTPHRVACIRRCGVKHWDWVMGRWLGILIGELGKDCLGIANLSIWFPRWGEFIGRPIRSIDLI